MATKNRTEPPDGIIVTLPANFFEEHNHEKYLRELKDTTKEYIWYRVCNKLPKFDILYVYTIIDNYIHHRANFAGVERDRDYSFPRADGTVREFKNANAILTTGPVIIAPKEKHYMQGFQGFHYTQLIF